MMMLRLILTVLARNFDIKSPPDTNEASMREIDTFVCYPILLCSRAELILSVGQTISPVSRYCNLILVPRKMSSQ
jgi:hypothetical protein